MSTATLLLRADTGAGIGAGHAARCLALAEAWREAGGQAVLALAPGHPALERWADEAGCAVEPVVAEAGSEADAGALLDTAGRHGAAWLAVDGYRFGAAYHERVTGSAAARVLWIDDYAALPSYRSALVLNQNPYAGPEMYPHRAEANRLLLGPRYALLRGPVRRRLGAGREHPPRARRLLVTAGGGGERAGVLRRTLTALAGLAEAPRLEVVVAAGGGFEPEAAAGAALARLEVLDGLAEIAGWMAWADLAVSAAGTTALECCALGLPALLVAVADNQRPVARSLAAAGAAVDLGWHEEVDEAALAREIAALADDPGRRQGVSARGRELVDGAGVERVTAALADRRLRLRPAGPEDRRRTWEWTNDPAVRAASFTTDPIGWDEHGDWLAARLADPDSRIFIALDCTLDGDDRPVGVVRFAIDGAAAAVSIALDPGRRGRGLGTELLALGCERLFAACPAVERIDAWIREGNEPSLGAFRKVGFTPAGGGEVSCVPARRLVLERSARG